MKMKFAFVMLVCVALSLSGCGSSPQNLIVGKWETGQAGGKITVEFAKDGKAKLTTFGQTLQGTYKVNSGDELEWTLNGKNTKCKMKVTPTKLELTSEGNTITYNKA
jgi:uncharacterized protein (TIGR03066 family)